ncbi:MAG TPA: DUF1513 domain-containing protein [Burkholderiaceae bacterium]|nr:DUF1513 domain-containing protein [Burkholderiaceae bacterium]
MTSPTRRRDWLVALAKGAMTAVMPLPTAAGTWAGRTGLVPTQRLVACWDEPSGAHRVGWLQVDGQRMRVLHSLELPTRGHGLVCLADGSLVVVARRPGDWLMRVPAHGAPVCVWMEAGRVTSGHVWTSADGLTVYTTEIDIDTGRGLLGVRHAQNLEKTDEWSTHGLDPHAVLHLPNTVLKRNGQAHPMAGMLFVANGGIEVAPETGRAKRNLYRMDSSVVCLHPQSGDLLGQWRLDDPRLSLRHLAWAVRSDGEPLLGVALQAEHQEPGARDRAPLLAILGWQGNPEGELRLASGQPPLSGYGGDIAVLGGTGQTGNGFLVSGTRSHSLVHYGLDGAYQGHTHCPDVGALTKGYLPWAAWRAGGLLPRSFTPSVRGDQLDCHARFDAGRLDNHWLLA